MITNVDLPKNVHAETLTGRDVVTGERLERVVVWADREFARCPMCDQPIPRVVDRCPVLLNAGAGQGGRIEEVSQQHGCGYWLPVLWSTVRDDESVEAVAARVSTRFADELADQRQQIEDRLRADLRDARDRLNAPLEPGETWEDREADALSGDDVAPGVCRDDGGELLAWDYDPLTEDGADVITVYESDLTQ